MVAKFKFLLLYFLSWVVFFDGLRLLFLLYHFAKTRELSFSTITATFWYGLRMDLSMAAYILLPVCLFVLLSLLIPFFRKAILYKIYTGVILFLVLIISICDLEIYNAWGFRIDATPLMFLSSPREALASVSHLPLVFILLGFIVAFLLLWLLFRFVLKKIFFDDQKRLRMVTALALLVLMGCLIIPIRGGFQLAPLNQSSVYFSTNNYANHSAINASWNLLHSLFSKGVSRKNPYEYLPAERQKQVIDSLYAATGSTTQLIRFPADTPTNVIVIVWESFTEKAIHISIENQEVTPQFNRLKQEGIYFSNVYATGDRTNKGVPGILSGYPAMPNTTVIHSPGKSAKLKVLSHVFKDRGYVTPFFYGGETEFANIKSYLLHAGFDPIISKNDFATKDMNSKWGTHDGIVMNRVFDELNKSAKPFFAGWLTLSSHEPFETPVPLVFTGKDIAIQFLNSIHYTDQVLSDFIDKCSKQPWWNNTVVIITADHGHRLPDTGHPADDFRIPMLWLGGALQQKGIVINKIISQLDIATTLAKQAGINENYFPFSKNILDPTTKDWAFFTFNNGFGFIDSTGRLTFDNVGKRPIQQEGAVGPKEIEAGKVLQQFTYEDFLRK
ncbi:MAG: sulfatase-like hydrolase/transferase [Chitinophagaceae bacterium]